MTVPCVTSLYIYTLGVRRFFRGEEGAAFDPSRPLSFHPCR
jgi:hypothetical protein